METGDFRIRKACAEDYQVFADVIRAAWEAMEQKEWFMADNAEYTYQMLTGKKGTGYKAVDLLSGQVAGVFMTVVPGMEEDNM